MMDDMIGRLLELDEPSVRLKVLANVLGRKDKSAEVRRLQKEISNSPRVRMLLSERNADGEIPLNPYRKWRGAHWVLATLADIGYPTGDESLIPLREQVLKWLFSRDHERSIQTIEGRVRRCASQEGNALYSLLAIGLADDRAEMLAERLIQWQWPDGGWNCDKRPGAVNSSFMETLIPLRALALHAKVTGSRGSKTAGARAAEVFLKRRLYRRQGDGSIISDDFIRLHYPCYWHYDILFGLKVMAEAGFISDKRCGDALDLLESRRLPVGGCAAEKRFYRVTGKATSGPPSLVDWGVTSKKRMNEFVTADALYVVSASGRLDV